MPRFLLVETSPVACTDDPAGFPVRSRHRTLRAALRAFARAGQVGAVVVVEADGRMRWLS